MLHKLIKQTDKRLNKQINKYGCRFRCLQAMAEDYLGIGLSINQIMAGYYLAIEDEAMNENCLTNENEYLITKRAFEMLGVKKKYYLNIGKMEGPGTEKSAGGLTFWEGKYLGWDYLVDRYLTNDGQHFILSRQDGKYYNPDDSARLVELKNKLLYRLVENG